MVVLAKVFGVEICAPGSFWVASLGCSMKGIHAFLKALDISTSPEYGGEALSPVEGVVELVKPVEKLWIRGYRQQDYVIVVRCGKLFVKISHVKPSVIPGDRVVVGDCIGRFIKSPGMSWDFPHMHIEVTKARRVDDRTQNCVIRISKEFVEYLRSCRHFVGDGRAIEMKPVYASKSYTLLQPIDGGCGVSVVAAGREAVVDGRLWFKPVYVHLISLDRKPPRPVAPVKICGTFVGQIKKTFHRRVATAVNTVQIFKELEVMCSFDPWKELQDESYGAMPLQYLDILVNGKPTEYLELFVGSKACAKVKGLVRDERLYVSVRRARIVPPRIYVDDDYLAL